MEGAPGARERKCIIPHDALTPFKDTRWLRALPFSSHCSWQRAYHRCLHNIHFLLWISFTLAFIFDLHLCYIQTLFSCILLTTQMSTWRKCQREGFNWTEKCWILSMQKKKKEKYIHIHIYQSIYMLRGAVIGTTDANGCGCQCRHILSSSSWMKHTCLTTPPLVFFSSSSPPSLPPYIHSSSQEMT